MRSALALLAVAAVLSTRVNASCVGDSDLFCCPGGYCDESPACNFSGGNANGSRCRDLPSRPGGGMCWRGKINICDLEDQPAVKAERAGAIMLTTQQAIKLRETLDLHGDHSSRPAALLLRQADASATCAGEQFVQLGDAKLRTRCQGVISELGLEVESVVFGGYVASHNDKQAVRHKLAQIGFH